MCLSRLPLSSLQIKSIYWPGIAARYGWANRSTLDDSGLDGPGRAWTGLDAFVDSLE